MSEQMKDHLLVLMASVSVSAQQTSTCCPLVAFLCSTLILKSIVVLPDWILCYFVWCWCKGPQPFRFHIALLAVNNKHGPSKTNVVLIITGNKQINQHEAATRRHNMIMRTKEKQLGDATRKDAHSSASMQHKNYWLKRPLDKCAALYLSQVSSTSADPHLL